MTRDLYFVLFEVAPSGQLMSVGNAPFSTGADGTSLLALLNMLRRGFDAVQQSMEPGGDKPTISTRVRELNSNDVFFFSYNRQSIAHDLPGSMVPTPGVVFALLRPSVPNMAWPPDAPALDQIAAAARSIADMNPGEQFAGLRQFVTGPSAHAAPVPFLTYDVFLSYARKDHALALEMKDLLEAHSLKVFLADMSLAPGVLWSEEIRSALLSARSAVVLLTPNSKDRPWVMAEAGALWVLQRPFIPALIYVQPNEIPNFISERQCIDINTIEGRYECAKAAVRHARSASPS